MSIRVTDAVPHGNVCNTRVEKLADRTVVHFSPSPHSGPEVMWFRFRVESGGGACGPLELILENCDNLLGGHLPETIRPVARTEVSDWRRLDAPAVATLPDGRREAAWRVADPGPWLDVALCYPYGMAEVECLVAETGGYYRADTIGASQGARPIVRLSNDYGTPGATRPGVYFVARQHSGETPGSWVLDGLLRRLAELGDSAPLVWAVPLAHTDGVAEGDYGKDGFPYDLNRAWGDQPMRHETLVIQRDAERWAARCRPALAWDFHAPGLCETDGIYCFLPKPADFPDQHRTAAVWAERIATALGPGLAAPQFARVATYASRWETPTFTAHFARRFGLPAASFETPYGSIGPLVATRETYRSAGAAFADALVSGLAVRNS